MVCGREYLLGKGWVTAFMKCHKSSSSRMLWLLRFQLPIQGAQICTKGLMLLECKPVISWNWDAEGNQENTVSVKTIPFRIKGKEK